MFNTLGELFQHLDTSLAVSVKGEIIALPEDKLLNLHFGLNHFIRTLVFYQNGSEEGKKYFSALGGPDEASDVLGRIYWRHLRGKAVSEEVVLKAVQRSGTFYLSDAEEIAVVRTLVTDYENAFQTNHQVQWSRSSTAE